MAGSQPKKMLALAMAAAALVVFAFSFLELPPPVEDALHEHIGHTLATEAIKIAKPGAKTTIIARDLETYPQPAMKHLLVALRADLLKAGVLIRSVEEIQLDPIRPNEVPSGDFYELLRRLPEGDVIVSLLGPPLLLPEHQAKLGKPRARVVALCIGRDMPTESFFNAGLLHAAIVNKPNPTGRTFDQLYSVVRTTP